MDLTVRSVYSAYPLATEEKKPPSPKIGKRSMYQLYYGGKPIGIIVDPSPLGGIDVICHLLSPDAGEAVAVKVQDLPDEDEED